MRRTNAKQVNFVPAEDVLERLNQSPNMTREINEALRAYYGKPSRDKAVELEARVAKLEELLKQARWE